jgi:hypothetical protein
MKQQEEWIALMIYVVVCSILILAFTRVMFYSYESSRTMGSRGQILTGDYLSVDKSSIDWGVLIPAENKTQEILITNNAPVAQKLSLTTAVWDPANASDYISLTWNYSGSSVAAKASIPVALEIHVDPLIFGISNFTFNIIISGVQT